MTLRYPCGRALIGTACGWLAYAVLYTLFQLSNRNLSRVFGRLASIVQALLGDRPLVRVLRDLAYVFAEGGSAAVIFRKLIIEGRAEELVGIVRGAVIRIL